jgi:hypothetical protein
VLSAVWSGKAHARNRSAKALDPSVIAPRLGRIQAAKKEQQLSWFGAAYSIRGLSLLRLVRHFKAA